MHSNTTTSTTGHDRLFYFTTLKILSNNPTVIYNSNTIKTKEWQLRMHLMMKRKVIVVKKKSGFYSLLEV